MMEIKKSNRLETGFVNPYCSCFSRVVFVSTENMYVVYTTLVVQYHTRVEFLPLNTSNVENRDINSRVTLPVML